MTERRAGRFCVLLLAVIPTLLFSDVLFRGSNFYLRDLYRYHFPMKRAVRDVIASGAFPYWNPAIAGGQPMAANPAYEIFYPPQWLIFIGPYDRGFALHILVHVYLALFGMYALLRALPQRPAAAFAGALSFGLGGFFLGTMTNLPTFFVWSWAGLGGWAALRFVRAPARRTFALAAAILAMPMLVAEPVALAQLWALLFAGAWMVGRGVSRSRGLAALRAVALLLGGVVLLSAVQLLPMLDHARDSARARGFSYEVVTDFSMPPIRPLELVTRGPIPSRYYPRGVPYFPSIYCGLFAAGFAIAGLVTRMRGSLPFAAIAAASYLFAVGAPFRLLYALGLRSIRYPEKFIAMGVVAMIVFAAIAADRLLKRPWLLLAACALAMLDLLPLANGIAPRMPREFFTPPPLARALPPGATLAHRAEWMLDDPNRARYERASWTWTMRNALRPLTPVAWGLRGVLEPDIDETFLLPTHDLLDAFRRSRGDDRVIALTGADYVADWGDPLIIRHLPGGRYRSSARILGVRETSNTATIDVIADTPSPLAMLVTRHKYWRVTVDGGEAAVAPANIAYQSVMVPAGRHRVEMRYCNPLVGWGAVISAFALVAITVPIPLRRRLRSGS